MILEKRCTYRFYKYNVLWSFYLLKKRKKIDVNSFLCVFFGVLELHFYMNGALLWPVRDGSKLMDSWTARGRNLRAYFNVIIFKPQTSNLTNMLLDNQTCQSFLRDFTETVRFIMRCRKRNFAFGFCWSILLFWPILDRCFLDLKKGAKIWPYNWRNIKKPQKYVALKYRNSPLSAFRRWWWRKCNLSPGDILLTYFSINGNTPAGHLHHLKQFYSSLILYQ